MIKAEVIEASRNSEGVTLWTIAVTYPRFIHSELMTHRVFSRNASSSRAVPIFKSISAVLRNSAAPVSLGSHKPGMQAGADLKGWRRILTKGAWNAARYAALGCAWVAMKAGAHKQVVNRILEPWSHITVLISTTNWANWDALRDHSDADPTIQALAKEIIKARQLAIRNGKVKSLKPGQWHLPYVPQAELLKHGLEKAIKISVARCARVSYLTHDRKSPDLQKDLALYERLAHHDPMHSSPLEHQATPDTRSHYTITKNVLGMRAETVFDDLDYDNKHEHGNFYGFRQNRKMLPNEAVKESYERKAA